MEFRSPFPSKNSASPPSLIPTCSKTVEQPQVPAAEDFEYDADCPFCAIARSFPPVNPLDDPGRIAKLLNQERTNPPSQVIYSGEYVLAFLDIQPLTWGHTLVIPRRHRVKMGDLEAADGAELGRHLPLIARAVIRAVFDLPYDPESLKVPGADYNIVQNNGPLAAQVVPHIHHHIIPRPADPPRTISSKPHKTPNPTSRLPQVPPAVQTSWTMFGRGSRTDLDETDPETQQLVRRMRVEIAREFGRESHGLRWSSAGIENEAPQPNEQAAALRPRDTDKASL